MVATSGQPQRPDPGEGGFTLIELMIVLVILTAVLGGTITLARQMQQSYGTELDDVAVEQEVRYALDWIARDLRSGASDPYDIIPDNLEVLIGPNGGADCDAMIPLQQYDSIQVWADIYPPDGDFVDPREKITIALANGVITRQDHYDLVNPLVAVEMTEAIVTNLCFTSLNAARDPTTNPLLVAYVRVQVTAQSRSRAANPLTGFFTSTLATEVRLRTR